MLLSSLACFTLMQEKKETFRAAILYTRLPILCFFFLFVVLMFIDKDTSGVRDSALSYAGESLVQYVVGPVAAHDYVLTHMQDYSGLPNHTFQFFLRIASMGGLITYNPPPTLDEWIHVPFATNVYTVYKFLSVDFGVYGATAIMSIIGFLHTLLYRKARTQSKFWLYVYSLSIFSVVMVIFDDWYSRFGIVYMSIRFTSWKIFPKRALKVAVNRNCRCR